MPPLAPLSGLLFTPGTLDTVVHSSIISLPTSMSFFTSSLHSVVQWKSRAPAPRGLTLSGSSGPRQGASTSMGV